MTRERQVWWGATLGIVLALSRAFIADSTAAFQPELAMIEVKSNARLTATYVPTFIFQDSALWEGVYKHSFSDLSASRCCLGPDPIIAVILGEEWGLSAGYGCGRRPLLALL